MFVGLFAEVSLAETGVPVVSFLDAVISAVGQVVVLVVGGYFAFRVIRAAMLWGAAAVGVEGSSLAGGYAGGDGFDPTNILPQLEEYDGGEYSEDDWGEVEAEEAAMVGDWYDLMNAKYGEGFDESAIDPLDSFEEYSNFYGG